jgi:hypothetical protein
VAYPPQSSGFLLDTAFRGRFLTLPVTDEEEPPPETVGTDGPGAVYVPETAADWALLGLPAPLAQWNCQETSGNLAAAIGTPVLTANGTPLYAQAVAGWTRTFVGTTDATASQRFHTTDAALDVAAGQSVAMLVYMSVGLAASTRRLFVVGGDGNGCRIAATTGFLLSTHNTTNATGASNLKDSLVRPYIWYRNATTDVSGTMSTLEHLLGTHSELALTGVARGLGPASTNTAATARYGLAAYWVGANAETIAAKATLTTLGWTVAW